MWHRRRAGQDPVDGQRAESLALQWLERRGLELVARNYRCRLGEIDLVMRDGATLVFIEVRYRRHSRYGSGLESVDPRKQQKLAHAASHFLASRRHYQTRPCRFDVMAGTATAGEAHSVTWHWVRNAFQPG